MATITSVKERIAKLNQADFQILCDALLAKEGYPGIVSLGTKEGETKTTPGTPDAYFCESGGKYVFAEYTTQKRGLTAKIRTDITKCLDEESTKVPLCEIAEIVYCHTSSNIKPADDYALKQLCEEKGVKLTLVGIDLLADMAMNYPSIIKDHLRLSIDSDQIQLMETFIKQQDSNVTAAPLETAFQFREKELSAIQESFDRVNAVLLVGPAGIGKTRLALEYAKNHAKQSNEKLFCIRDRSIPLYEDLRLYFENPGEYFVFIDDANQLSELKHVLEYVNKVEEGYIVHVLMTVRDYAVPKVKLDMSGVVQYESITLTPFTDEEISSLVKKHYGIINRAYLDRIVQIAEGNARIAMLAGRIASDTNRLDSINDVSGLYSEYFGKVLEETGIASEKGLLITAGMMAFLNSIHLDHIDPLLSLLKEKGISQEDFVNNIKTLHEHEILDICNDKAVLFSEQCMANFVLKYVFFDKKSIKLSDMIETCFDQYRQRTINAVNTLVGVFRNAELHNYVETEILDLWNKLEDEKSTSFFDYLKTFFPVNEIKTIRLIQDKIDSEIPVSMNGEDINTEEGKNNQVISNEIITILGGFSNLENLDSALDLFFQYYLKRPDLYMQFYHATISYFSIDVNSEKYCYRTQNTLFTKINEYLQNGDNAFIAVLLCEIASHFLMLEFSPYENTRDGKGITIYHVPIALSEGVKEYRSLIWEQLLVLSSKELYDSRIKSLLRSYGKTIHDCSKEVIKDEADYICELAKRILSPNCLADCLIAQSLQDVFEVAEFDTAELQPFINNAMFELYQLAKGPKPTLDIPYEERQKTKENGIRDYILIATDKTEAFKKLLELYVEITADQKSFDIAKAIDIALQTLSKNKEEYINCVSMLLSSEKIENIDINHIAEELFSMLSPQEIKDLLDQSSPVHRNEWLFAYYNGIPQRLINDKELKGLYEFLKDESDRDIQTSLNRDISFLDKYLQIDDKVITTASRIILNKKEYSPFVVNLYFGLQFNEYHIAPHAVINKFSQDINLLEQIYLCVADYSRVVDFQGPFLKELFDEDKTFVKEFEKWFVEKVDEEPINDYEPIMELFYQEDNYYDILDFLVNESIRLSAYPTISVPQILKLSLEPLGRNNDLKEKVDCWVKHYIERHFNDSLKMDCLFEALTETSMSLAMEYIPVFVRCTDDYELFKKIPLTPRSFSWSGSCVPMYSKWIDNLNGLLPHFSGLRYIRHKERVQELIRVYRNKIQEEEIFDILYG